MPFVWSIGTIIGPSIGGYFAHPAKNFPDTFPRGGIFDKFPYLLPNVICAGLMFVSIIAGYLLLDETHPDMQPWSTPDDLEHTEAETPLIPAQAGTTTAAVNLAQESSYGTFNRVNLDQEEQWRINEDGTRPASPIAEKTKPTTYTRRVVMLIVALGIFTYHSMTYDHLLPIFFQDEREGKPAVVSLDNLGGGLGLSIQDVGIIMSVNGIIALFVQAVVFPLAASFLGVWKLFIIVTVLHPVAYFIVPYLAMLPAEALYPGIYFCLTVRNVLSILAYPLLLILIKEAAPSPTTLGKINGLAASTGAACRCLASPIAGLLYGVGIQINFVALAWWASALVALVGAIQAFMINRRRSTEHHVVTSRLVPKQKRGDVVHVHIQNVFENQNEEEAETTDERQRLIEA